MESESGAKISIRGRGSVKEGKVKEQPGEDEDLHCMVMADSEEKIQVAIDMITQVIETATSVPEGHNELKKLQLRELAALNGTLRADEEIICANCGEAGHRRYECTAKRNVTNSVICRVCGGVGHFARDCMARNDPSMLEAAKNRESKMDNEYQSLMKELGGGQGSSSAPWGAGGSSAAPWAKPDDMPSVPASVPTMAYPAGMVMAGGEVPPGLELPPGMPGMSGMPGMGGNPIVVEEEDDEMDLPPGIDYVPGMEAMYAQGYQQQGYQQQGYAY